MTRASIPLGCAALLILSAQVMQSRADQLHGSSQAPIVQAGQQAMKYEIIRDDTVDDNAITLYRVRRLSDGLLGGYIENERNLSQAGKSFAYDGSRISGNALVEDDAKVFGRVTGNAVIAGRAQLFGRATDDAEVTDDAVVRGTVSGKAVVRGRARVFGRVTGSAVVEGDDVVFGNLSR